MRLVALQEKDRKAMELRAELARVPEEKRNRERQLEEGAARLRTFKGRLVELEVKRKQLEVEVSAKREKIQRYKGQQLQTRKNEEYAALGHEIEIEEKKIQELEDAELELMEEAENLAPRIKEAEGQHEVEVENIRKSLVLLDERMGVLSKRLEELRLEREKASYGIPEDVLEVYERLFQSKKGAAIVPLEHGICTGCHMKVPQQVVLDATACRSLVNCPNCGRLVFLGST